MGLVTFGSSLCLEFINSHKVLTLLSEGGGGGGRGGGVTFGGSLLSGLTL